MTKIPKVTETLELPVMSHVLRFKRLRWKDMPPVNKWMEEHKMVDKLAVTAHALFNISGRDVTPDEALKVLIALPKAAQHTIFKFYKGSLDPHRMVEMLPLWKAPDAATYRRDLDEEEAETEGTMDAVEEALVQKFGAKAIQEEKALAHQIVTNTGYAGAMRLEEDFMASAQQNRQDKEEW